MYYISSLSDEWSSSVVQAAHSLTAASADAQLIVTPPTTINKIYKSSSKLTLAIVCRTDMRLVSS